MMYFTCLTRFQHDTDTRTFLIIYQVMMYRTGCQQGTYRHTLCRDSAVR